MEPAYPTITAPARRAASMACSTSARSGAGWAAHSSGLMPLGTMDSFFKSSPRLAMWACTLGSMDTTASLWR